MRQFRLSDLQNPFFLVSDVDQMMQRLCPSELMLGKCFEFSKPG